MTKSVREQVESAVWRILLAQGELADSPTRAIKQSQLMVSVRAGADLLVENRELFAAAEETAAALADSQAEVATLRAFQADDAEHYRQMCEAVGADHDCMTGGHEHLVSYLAGYEQEYKALQSEVARLRGVIEEAAQWAYGQADSLSDEGYSSWPEGCRIFANNLRAALSPQPAGDDQCRS